MTTQYPAEDIGALIRETFRAMVGRVEHQFAGTDLGLSQWLTLKLTGFGTISCIGDVTRELGLDTGASTRLIDQLENRGLVVRRRSMTDRRVVGVALTQQGEAIVNDMQPHLNRFWKKQLDIFTEDERNLLLDMLTRLRNILEFGQTCAAAPNDVRE